MTLFNIYGGTVTNIEHVKGEIAKIEANDLKDAMNKIITITYILTRYKHPYSIVEIDGIIKISLEQDGEEYSYIEIR